MRGWANYQPLNLNLPRYQPSQCTAYEMGQRPSPPQRLGHPPFQIQPPPASIVVATAAADDDELLLLESRSRTSPEVGASAEAAVVPALSLMSQKG